jgi:hypothetical protein
MYENNWKENLLSENKIKIKSADNINDSITGLIDKLKNYELKHPEYLYRNNYFVENKYISQLGFELKDDRCVHGF